MRYRNEAWPLRGIVSRTYATHIFTDGQCWTLQRRVQEWRAQSILAFDEQWLGADALVTARLPRPLRVLTLDQTEQRAMAAIH